MKPMIEGEEEWKQIVERLAQMTEKERVALKKELEEKHLQLKENDPTYEEAALRAEEIRIKCDFLPPHYYDYSFDYNILKTINLLEECKVLTAIVMKLQSRMMPYTWKVAENLEAAIENTKKKYNLTDDQLNKLTNHYLMEQRFEVKVGDIINGN